MYDKILDINVSGTWYALQSYKWERGLEYSKTIGD